MIDSFRSRLGPVKRCLEAAVALVYPEGCVVCSAETSLGHHLCHDCADEIQRAASRQCPRCAASLGPHVKPAKTCPVCASRTFSFKRALASGPYQGPLGAMVRSYKYDRRLELAVPLALGMVQTLERNNIAPDLVVPVPMHPLKRFRRGFDHAALLASKIARHIDRPRLTRVLRRKKLGSSMVGLAFHARMKLASEVYALRPDSRLKDRSVLLVDDVMTTGATASACARLLRDGGAQRVYVVVVARQSSSLLSQSSPATVDFP